MVDVLEKRILFLLNLILINMRKLFLFALIFLLAACSPNLEKEGVERVIDKVVNLTQEEFLSIAYGNPRELNADEVKAIASDFLYAIREDKDGNLTRSDNSDFTLNVTSKSYFTQENVSSTRTLTKKGIELPVYEVSVTSEQKNGTIYVAADERNAEVITYIPKAAQDSKVFVESGSAFLVEWAKASSYERLLETEEIREKLHDATVAKISEQLGIDESEVTMDNIVDKIVVEGTRATPIKVPTTQIVLKCAPLVKTEWSQNGPYNFSLPVPNAPSTQAHVYAGCAVTAACQLMTAIKPNLTLGGTVIDWDYLTETQTINADAPQRKLDMLGKLHSWVYDQLDATPQYDSFGYHNGTGVSPADQIDFYGCYFNHSEDYSAYEPDALLHSFEAGRPSLIRGQGHAWIVDGYIIAQKAITSSSMPTRAVIVKYYDMFWHANLGWGGTANGYYKLKLDTHVDFEASGHLYTTDGLYIYPGLYKKDTIYNY